MLYKVKAKIKRECMEDFFIALNDGSVETQKPDGAYIVSAMKEAKMLDAHSISWYEGCYCETPLKHERETVYDKYLEDFETEMVLEVKDDITGASFWQYLQAHSHHEAEKKAEMV
ncbi:MAG: hypothetical protein GQ531_02355 [Sulfurovum sp.]|nr:hypothetical protein [Sulfurovum sp.]